MADALDPLRELVAVLCSIEARAVRIQETLDRFIEHVTYGERIIMSDLDDLTAEVAQVATVEASAAALIQGLAQQIAAAAPGNLKIQALSQQLAAATAPLSAAILANTPAPSPAAPVAPPASAPVEPASAD